VDPSPKGERAGASESSREVLVPGSWFLVPGSWFLVPKLHLGTPADSSHAWHAEPYAQAAPPM
jgi:hypothetical protein